MQHILDKMNGILFNITDDKIEHLVSAIQEKIISMNELKWEMDTLNEDIATIRWHFLICKDNCMLTNLLILLIKEKLNWKCLDMMPWSIEEDLHTFYVVSTTITLSAVAISTMNKLKKLVKKQVRCGSLLLAMAHWDPGDRIFVTSGNSIE